MKKVKFYYNPKSLKYEKYEEPLKNKLIRLVGFLSSAFVFAAIAIAFAYKYLDSPKEKILKQEINVLKNKYKQMDKKLEQMQVVMKDLEHKDDNIYRTIFEAEPLDNAIRNASYGGADRYGELSGYETSDMMKSSAEKIDRLKNKLVVQSKSYDELLELVKRKAEMLASIPAIQPVENKLLERVASGFGYRIHPIYKVRKMHTGMDFTAPTGTPIYVTGDGYVSEVVSNSGYGQHVIINHGFGYETLYAHMSKILVRKGQKVKRGEKIGLVGNTGLSSGPHLHYEVIKGGEKIDPANFYYNDLSTEEYEKMLELSDSHNQSFD